MSGFIIIDTEGTGLFRHKNPDGSVARSDEPGQPRMAEYAHVLVNDRFEVEGTYQRYIMPDNWRDADCSLMQEMPAEAFAVHGLTFDFLRENGQPVWEVLQAYREAKVGRAVLGFNQQHDGRQMRAELRIAGLPDDFEQTPSTCAMRSITSNYKGMVKKLNGKGGFPRLIDAAAHFNYPGYEEEKRHSALEDALATHFVSKCLHELGKLLPAEVHYNKALERS
jgi:DNA polymerase III epsilon subunit-like protein